jgi:hypothetical protein
MIDDVIITCPLGSKCEEIKDNKIHRCAWYTKIVGTDPQDSKKEYDDWKCAIAWMPILDLEVANINRINTSTLASFRNEVVDTKQSYIENK